MEEYSLFNCIETNGEMVILLSFDLIIVVLAIHDKEIFQYFKKACYKKNTQWLLHYNSLDKIYVQ